VGAQLMSPLETGRLLARCPAPCHGGVVRSTRGARKCRARHGYSAPVRGVSACMSGAPDDAVTPQRRPSGSQRHGSGWVGLIAASVTLARVAPGPGPLFVYASL
jgi:hypothetical protein